MLTVSLMLYIPRFTSSLRFSLSSKILAASLFRSEGDSEIKRESARSAWPSLPAALRAGVTVQDKSVEVIAGVEILSWAKSSARPVRGPSCFIEAIPFLQKCGFRF